MKTSNKCKRPYVSVTGDGVPSVKSAEVIRSEDGKRQLKALKKIREGWEGF